jgi:hypothetical protein
MDGRPVEIFVQVVPPSVVSNTPLLLYCPKDTQAVFGSSFFTEIQVIDEELVGRVPEMSDQLEPPSVVR